MAEVRKIVCDICGRDIENGYSIRPAARRRITHGSGTNENYRFDVCDSCFKKLKELCSEKEKAK